MRLHVLQHAPFERPSHIMTWAKKKDANVGVTRFHEKNWQLPAVSDVDLLVVMGGPMSVHDEKTYPWLVQEKAFLRDYIAGGCKVLGVCLGAQLAADALGARVFPNEQKEIGWYSVYKTGLPHPVFWHVPETSTVLHWHGDTFELPDGAVHLAHSDATAHQAFIWNDQVLGLQYHLEMNSDDIEELLSQGKDYLENSTGSYVQSAPMIRNGIWHSSVCMPLLDGMLDRFIA